jgi:hypothetical protein
MTVSMMFQNTLQKQPIGLLVIENQDPAILDDFRIHVCCSWAASSKSQNSTALLTSL